MFLNLTSIDKLTEVGGAPTCALPCLLETMLPLIVYLTVYFTLRSSLSQDDRIRVGKTSDMDQQRHTEGQRTLFLVCQSTRKCHLRRTIYIRGDFLSGSWSEDQQKHFNAFALTSKGQNESFNQQLSDQQEPETRKEDYQPFGFYFQPNYPLIWLLLPSQQSQTTVPKMWIHFMGVLTLEGDGESNEKNLELSLADPILKCWMFTLNSIIPQIFVMAHKRD